MFIDVCGKRLLVGIFERPRYGACFLENLLLGMHSKLSPFSENYCWQYWQLLASKGKKKSIFKCPWHEICFLHFLVDSSVLKLEKTTLAPRAFSLSIFSGIESTLWRRKGVPIKRASKTIMLHSRDVENCENTAATLVGKRRNREERTNVLRDRRAKWC